MLKAGVRRMGFAAWLALLACGELPPPPPPRPPPSTGVEADPAAQPPTGAAGGAANAAVAFQTGLPGPAPRVSVGRNPDYEQADLDPDNDLVVAPPPAIEGCDERLKRAGISFIPTTLKLRKERTTGRSGRRELVSCGAEQVVSYAGGPARIKYNGAPLLTCRMALALARFEELAQAQAQRHFGQRITRFEHLGTYSCRKMVRFDFVSEHSYANAIDIGEMTLQDGSIISVARHFGALDAPPATPQARFLRSLARRAYDERLFSTVLTPFWDHLHRDHFHLDLARYRVDGASSLGTQ